MFKNLSKRLSESLERIKTRGVLNNKNIKDVLHDIKLSLIEADVSLPVVKNFINRVKEDSVGKKIIKSLTPGQTFISLVKNSLQIALGSENKSLNLLSQPPVVIMIIGSQGSGKTTSTAKIAKFLRDKHKKKVMVASCDIYRPAAIKQLEYLVQDLDKIVFPFYNETNDLLETVKYTFQESKNKICDVFILDTPGFLHNDDEMMEKIRKIQFEIKPSETIFVADSMLGQDSINMARSFNDNLDLTGVFLTKIDGDSRGGAALSITETIKKPIKFLGIGEKLDNIEIFHPDRIASRILGMGDVLSLIDQVEKKSNKNQAKSIVKKINGEGKFNLEDFKNQLLQMKKMGGFKSILSRLPHSMSINKFSTNFNDKTFKKMEIIINSMTFFERQNPECLKGSRKKRIANGSGTTVSEVNMLLRHFLEMKKMMKKTMRNRIMKNKMFSKFF